MIYDSIVIGLSAGGISSAIYLKRRGINFLILGKDFGGEMALSGDIDNYPGILKTNGIELTKKFKEHLLSYDIEPIIDEVISIEKKENFFIVKSKKSEYLSKSLIISTGSRPKKLNVSGENKFYHKGISYCSVCDMPIFKDKVVAIIGGGNSANEAGLMASKLCKFVYVITKNEDMKGDQILIKKSKSKDNIKIITNSFVQEIYGDNFVEGLKYLDTKTNEIFDIKVNGVFIHIGMIPNSDFVPDDWNVKNSYKEIVVNKLCETNIRGFFAAGDVTDIPYKQISIAVGQGIIAALSCISYLNKINA